MYLFFFLMVLSSSQFCFWNPFSGRYFHFLFPSLAKWSKFFWDVFSVCFFLFFISLCDQMSTIYLFNHFFYLQLLTKLRLESRIFNFSIKTNIIMHITCIIQFSNQFSDEWQTIISIFFHEHIAMWYLYIDIYVVLQNSFLFFLLLFETLISAWLLNYFNSISSVMFFMMCFIFFFKSSFSPRLIFLCCRNAIFFQNNKQKKTF